MTLEEYPGYARRLEERYQVYNLSFEQASRIYWFEQERDYSFSSKNGFSVWEEMDYELSVFRTVLDQHQFEKYEALYLLNVKEFENSLQEQDAGKLNDIQFAKARLDYYENQFLPSFGFPQYQQGPMLFSELNKIDFLKKEYKIFVNARKKQLLVDHFRENRTFMPNLLKFSVLWQEVDYLWPNYLAFQQQMDHVTRTMDTYLRERIGGYHHQAVYLNQQIEKLNEFALHNFAKYQRNIGGWHVQVKTDPEKSMQDGLMALLLMDRGNYGLISSSL